MIARKRLDGQAQDGQAQDGQAQDGQAQDGGADHHESAETVLIRAEFWKRMLAAAARLEPLPRQCFLACHMRGESLQEMAEATGKSSDAVRMILARSHRQVYRLLLRQGWTETEVDEYHALFARRDDVSA